MPAGTWPMCASPANEGLSATTTGEGFHTLQIASERHARSRFESALQTLGHLHGSAEICGDKSRRGTWPANGGDLENVAIHAHLTPTGKVLYWGRGAVVGDTSFTTLNEHACKTFLWDPATGDSGADRQNNLGKRGTGLFAESLLKPRVGSTAMPAWFGCGYGNINRVPFGFGGVDQSRHLFNQQRQAIEFDGLDHLENRGTD